MMFARTRNVPGPASQSLAPGAGWMRWLIAAMVACLWPLWVAGCGESQEAGSPVDEADQPTPTIVRSGDAMAAGGDDDLLPVIEVADGLSFLEAIGPDRRIHITEGTTIQLDELPRGNAEYYRWRQAHGQEFELVIRDVRNLTIRGLGHHRADILTAYGYANVLRFERCEGIELINLRFGHDPEPGQCIGGVIVLIDCRDVVIEDCVLFGSGTEGLTMERMRGLRFIRSNIEDCTHGILVAIDCRDLRFEHSVFRDNERYFGFSFTDTVGVVFDACRVEGNLVTSFSPALFTSNLEEGEEAVIQFNGGLIRGNRFQALAHPMRMLAVDESSLGDNVIVPDPDSIPLPPRDRLPDHGQDEPKDDQPGASDPAGDEP
ncbi:MAG: right-handed parallel beta-helix repeat-containing protein [Phycisphaeraceae bacterium]|nr:right-handed parallel beta-helix repeat-containing protein [Phycisphaeraceae bacterium]